MKYKIVTSGKSKEVTLSYLSRNLKPSSEFYALSDREVYLGLISHQTLVLFATEFADYAIKNYTKKITPEAEICIHLTRKWLEDRESVSDEELRAAAAYAAYAAAAADAAYAAYAAADAAYAAYAPANAAYAAYYVGKYREKEFERQGTFIIDFLKTGKNLFLV